jgi:hypothetical protein
MSVRFFRCAGTTRTVVERETDNRTKEARFGAGTIDRAYGEKRRKQDEKSHAENRTDKAVTSHPRPASRAPYDGWALIGSSADLRSPLKIVSLLF